jgi:hypothetical protein
MVDSYAARERDAHTRVVPLVERNAGTGAFCTRLSIVLFSVKERSADEQGHERPSGDDIRGAPAARADEARLNRASRAFARPKQVQE